MGRRRNPWLLHAGRGATYFLKASLTFSPASLRLAFAWSPLPSFSVLLSPVTLPTASLALPPRSWALFFALSAPLTASPTSRESTQVAEVLARWVPRQPVSKTSEEFHWHLVGGVSRPAGRPYR